MIDGIRAREPEAAFRSSFIVGFPGETEAAHDGLLDVPRVRRRSTGPAFFAFSPEDGTPAATLPGAVAPELVGEWLRECDEVQDPITRAARDALVGTEVEVLVDAFDPATRIVTGRTHREAPEIDGVVLVRGVDVGAAGRARACARHRVRRPRPRRQERCRGAGWVGPMSSRVERSCRPTCRPVTRPAPPARPSARSGSARARSSHRPTSSLRRGCCSRSRRSCSSPTKGSSWLTVSLWFVLACTDRLDGWLARRDGTTRSGAFLDPLADKFLVIGGFAALGVRGDFSWLAVTIVAVREVGHLDVPLVRGPAWHLAARAELGKGKAFFQFLAVGAVLLPWTYEWATVHDIILWIAVVLTLVSGLQILRAGWRLQRQQKRERAASEADGGTAVRCDVLAIGTELLLGQIVDTNSSWIGEHLAAAGIDTCEHRKVGDNLARMVQCLQELLERADAVIVCGGLGPTPDDVTREAIAEVMGVELERREELIEEIAQIFGGRGRDDARQQPAPGRRAEGRRCDPEPDRHRAGPAVRGRRGRRHEGRLRGARACRTR